jgi:thiosulfate/3-mercaptopyruvate sulfurtransferase
MNAHAHLVDTGWLAGHLADPDLLVCDCRFASTKEASEAAYLAGHVPGAIHVYWLDDLCTADTTVTSLLPTPTEAERSLGALGIRHETMVVGYVEAASPYAARLWHVLTHYGHARIAVLDGGVDRWAAEGRPLQVEPVTPTPAVFEPASSGRATIGADEIRARLDDPTLTTVDVRTPAEYEGSQRRAARGGHIPGALLLPWDGDLRSDGTLRPASEIQARARAAGLRLEDELVTYCQGGVRAAHAALALRLAGYPHVRVYDGSWAEWGNDPRLPIQTSMVEAAV